MCYTSIAIPNYPTGGASAILEPPAEEPAATYRVRIEGDLIITVERDE